jgi:thioredoxin 1
MAITTILDSDFEEKVIKSSTPTAVDFFATWCGPCKMAEPVLEELSVANQGKVSFYKLDVDANQKTAKDFDVMSIPTTILFKDGKEIARQIGFAGKEGFEELLKKLG